MKDEYNALLPLRQPGYLVESLGARVEQFYALEKAMPVSGTWGSGEASVWAEYLKVSAPDAEVLLRYGVSNGWLDGQPAVVTHRSGKGRVTYIGAVLDENTMAAAADWMLKDASVVAVFGAVPEGVEVSRRVSPNATIFVLINFKTETRTITLPFRAKSLLEQRDTDRIELSQFGVAVLAVPKLDVVH
jgi:beta-galactosidase